MSKGKKSINPSRNLQWDEWAPLASYYPIYHKHKGKDVRARFGGAHPLVGEMVAAIM